MLCFCLETGATLASAIGVEKLDCWCDFPTAKIVGLANRWPAGDPAEGMGSIDGHSLQQHQGYSHGGGAGGSNEEEEASPPPGGGSATGSAGRRPRGRPPGSRTSRSRPSW